MFPGNYDSEGDIWSGELRLNGSVDVFGRSVNLTGGVDHTELNYQFGYRYVNDPIGTVNIYEGNFGDLAIVEPTAGFSDSPFGEFDSTGVYGQVHFRPIERLGILLGGRHDWVTAREEPKNKREREFTGRAGLTFDLSQQITVYGLYAQSFTPVTSQGRSGILDPETGETYETGVKTEWFDGKLGLNAALFRIERDNVPIRDPNNGPQDFFSVSAGLQRADGFEVEVKGSCCPAGM